MSSLLHDYIAGADASKPEICNPEQYCEHGKKRPKNTAHIEKEIVALCTNLAVSNDSL